MAPRMTARRYSVQSNAMDCIQHGGKVILLQDFCDNAGILKIATIVKVHQRLSIVRASHIKVASRNIDERDIGQSRCCAREITDAQRIIQRLSVKALRQSVIALIERDDRAKMLCAQCAMNAVFGLSKPACFIGMCFCTFVVMRAPSGSAGGELLHH